MDSPRRSFFVFVFHRGAWWWWWTYKLTAWWGQGETRPQHPALRVTNRPPSTHLNFVNIFFILNMITTKSNTVGTVCPFLSCQVMSYNIMMCTVHDAMWCILCTACSWDIHSIYRYISVKTTNSKLYSYWRKFVIWYRFMHVVLYLVLIDGNIQTRMCINVYISM